MIWKSALPIKHSAAQQGAISPFMFGLIVGVSIFSVMSAHYARKELDNLQIRQAKRAQVQAEDVVKALEFSALTETRATYSEDFTMDRARGNLARATGSTRGGQEYIMNQQENGDETFQARTKQVAVTASDDTLLRAKVYQLSNADDMDGLDNNPNRPVAVLDTSGVRQRQVLSSTKAMEGMAEQIYAFYSGHMRFPDDGEYQRLESLFPYKDAWGGTFDYIRTNDEDATLEFTTPWNYTQRMNLSLKNEDEQ